MKAYALLLVGLLVGCATKPQVPQSIMPPKMKIAKSGLVPVQRTNFTLHWEDCGEQPTNIWYRVFETRDLKERTLYVELTNAYSLVIPTIHAWAFYTVEATDGTKSMKAGKDCP